MLLRLARFGARIRPLRLAGVRNLAQYPPEINLDGKTYKTDEWTNVPPFILELTKRQLHQDPNHPIGILRDLIETNFRDMGYTFYNDFKPVVTTYENFDVLGFPQDHPGRSKSDTYYLNGEHLLRTHSSVSSLARHQGILLLPTFIGKMRSTAPIIQLFTKWRVREYGPKTRPTWNK